MKTTEISQAALEQTTKSFNGNTPFAMLNLLRFREQADYSNHHKEKKCSGMEAYLERYVPAFQRVADREEVPVQLSYIAVVKGLLVAPPEERWDVVALVLYPDFTSFRKVIESPLYSEIAEHHRFAALEDFRLLVTVKADFF